MHATLQCNSNNPLFSAEPYITSKWMYVNNCTDEMMMMMMMMILTLMLILFPSPSLAAALLEIVARYVIRCLCLILYQVDRSIQSTTTITTLHLPI